MLTAHEDFRDWGTEQISPWCWRMGVAKQSNFSLYWTYELSKKKNSLPLVILGILEFQILSSELLIIKGSFKDAATRCWKKDNINADLQ
jgi:hypothetical protein